MATEGADHELAGLDRPDLGRSLAATAAAESPTRG
jgi:hypothetical protein